MTGSTSAKECSQEPHSPLRHLPRAVPPPTKKSFSSSSHFPSDPVHCYSLSPRRDLGPHPSQSQKTACKESGWGTEGGKVIQMELRQQLQVIPNMNIYGKFRRLRIPYLFAGWNDCATHEEASYVAMYGHGEDKEVEKRNCYGWVDDYYIFTWVESNLKKSNAGWNSNRNKEIILHPDKNPKTHIHK